MTQILKIAALPVTELVDGIQAMKPRNRRILGFVALLVILGIILVCILKGEKIERFRRQVAHWFYVRQEPVGVCAGLIYLAAIGILYFRKEHQRVNDMNRIHAEKLDGISKGAQQSTINLQRCTIESQQAKIKQLKRDLQLTRAEMEATLRDVGKLLQDPTRTVLARGWRTDPYTGAKFCILFIYHNNPDGTKTLESTVPIWRVK